MLAINRQNYEAFFIDYLDGNLKGSDLSDFQAFLSKNTELWEELQEFESCQLLISDETFPDKMNLKKSVNDIETISENNFEEMCIAHYEGDLDNEQDKKLKDYIHRHPESKNVYAVYSKTFIKPDLKIKFNKKGSLKKLTLTQKRNRVLYTVASIAALLLLVITISQKTNVTDIIDNNQLATQISSVKIEKQHTTESMKNIDTYEIDEVDSTNEINNDSEANEYKNNIIFAGGTNVIKASDTTTSHATNPLFAEKLHAIDISEIPCCAQPYEPVFVSQYTLASNYQTDVNAAPLMLKDIALYELKTIIYQDEVEQEPKKFSFWEVAEASINTINRISDADIQLSKKTDTNGKVQALAINGVQFGFSTTRVRK